MSEISLEDLQIKLDAMTPGPYEVRERCSIVSNYEVDRAVDQYQAHICDVSNPANFAPLPVQSVHDAIGIVAFHNAAQLLLDIAQAAQELVSTSLGRWEEVAAREKLLITCGKLNP